MNYRYLARDPMGRRVDGEIEASSREQVVLELKGRALEPIDVRLIESKGKKAADIVADIRTEEGTILDMIGMAEPKGAEAAEKGGASRWFGFLFLIIYVLYKLFR